MKGNLIAPALLTVSAALLLFDVYAQSPPSLNATSAAKPIPEAKQKLDVKPLGVDGLVVKEKPQSAQIVRFKASSPQHDVREMFKAQMREGKDPTTGGGGTGTGSGGSGGK